MEANVSKSRSDLSQRSQWVKHPPPCTPPLPRSRTPPPLRHHLDAKTLSSGRLSRSSGSTSLSRHLNPDDLHHDDHSQQFHGHGGKAVSVPFTWESEPGTPKVRRHDNVVVPPLMPPPSYFYNPAPSFFYTPARETDDCKQRRKKKFLATILPKLKSSSSSPPVSPSASTRSLWSSAPPSPATGGRARTSTRILSLPTRGEKWEEKKFENNVPTLCFGFGRRGTNAKPRSFYLAIVRVLRRKFP